MPTKKKAVKKTKNLVQRRPAETTTGVAGAIVLLLSSWFNWDADTATAATVVVAAIPGLVTWWVSSRG